MNTQFKISNCCQIDLAGQLALIYEYIPANLTGPTIPKPSMLWLFDMGLLPLVVRQFSKKGATK